MSTLRERLNALTIEVTSPDKQLKARLKGDDNLILAFRPQSYERYTERELEHQLERLAVLAWIAYRRGYFKALNPDGPATGGEPDKPHWNAKYRRYHEDVAEMVGKGKSPSGLIEARSKGLAFWKVRIQDGALRQLDEAQFVQDALGAFKNVRRDSENQRILLKDKHFGLNLPPKARAAKSGE